MSKVKPWLFIAVIFIAGAITGAALTMGFGPPFRHNPLQAMNKLWMSRLTQELNLTPDQQAKIQPIVTDSADQMQKVRRDQFEQMTKIIDATNKAIAAILTPDQQQKLAKMESEMDQNRDKMFPGHKRMHEYGGPPGGPGQHWPMMPPPPQDDQKPVDQAAPPPPPPPPAK